MGGRRAAGAFRTLLLGGLLLPAAGCAPEPPPPTDPELRAELGIAESVSIHRIDLSGRGARTRVLPPEIRIRPGDVVQIVVLDRRVHQVRFPADGLAPEVRAFLERSSQDRFPPLVEREARLVLSFEDAPPGRYPFRVEGHGDPGEGLIRVLEP